MKIKFLLLISIYIIASKSHASDLPGVSTYLVDIKECPSTLKLSLPNEFVLAKYSRARELRKHLLQSLNEPYSQQPYSKAKAHYSEVFLIDWDAALPFPRIQISSPGSVQKGQGHITEDTWEKIISATLNMNKQDRDRKFDNIKDYYSKQGVDMDVKWLEPYVENSNTVVINAIGEASLSEEGKKLNYIGGTKLIYVRKCVTAVYVYVDLETPKAFSVLSEYMSKITVE